MLSIGKYQADVTAQSEMATIRRRESNIEEKPKILEAVTVNSSGSCEEAATVEEKAHSIVTVKVLAAHCT